MYDSCSQGIQDWNKAVCMKAKTAGLLFLVICVVLAALLLAGFITPLISGSIFAVALALLGGMSGGFRKGR